MIVNPQFFNYRLIIGSLVVAVTVLTVFSITSYQSIISHQKFLEQEKKLVESELSQMIDRYDEVSISNKLIASKLELAKTRAHFTLDSLQGLRSDLSVLSKYRQQLNGLELKNKYLFSTLDSITNKNEVLEQENRLAQTDLQKKERTISSLKKENTNLTRAVKKGSVLSANSFKAHGFQSISGSKVPSSKAKQVNSFDVSFSLAKNVLIDKGQKDLYVQILNPKNNVIADKGVVSFGAHSLIYSEKLTLNYTNTVMAVHIDIAAQNNEQPLLKGVYHISVFHDNQKLGSTQVTLN